MTSPFVGTHTETDWSSWSGQNHRLVDDGVTLATASRLQYVSPTWLVQEPALPFDVVDLDVDDCGDVWLLSPDGVIRRYDADADDLRRINCTWDTPPARPSAIAVTETTVYVAAASTNEAQDSPAEDGDSETTATPGTRGRLYAFSRHLMQPRWVNDDYRSPVALARHENTVSVLDAGGPDPFLAVVGPGGRPVDVSTGFGQPVDAAADAAGDRYVLDLDSGGDGDRNDEGDNDGGATDGRDGHGEPSVHRIPAGGTAVETLIPPESFVTADSGVTVAPSVIGAGTPGEVVVGDGDAKPSEYSVFRYQPATEDFERLTTYAGPVERLLLCRSESTRDPGLYVVGDDGHSASFLPAAERTRRNPDTGRYDGQVVARLDAGERGMQWHRITTALASNEPGTQVRLSYHATDDETLEFREPGTGGVVPMTAVSGIGKITAGRLRDAYIDGLDELALLDPERVAALASTEHYRVSVPRARRWIDDAQSIVDRRGLPGDLDWQTVDPHDPHDALVSDAEGRFLWVKVELVGTPAAAPRVDALRAYFPRESYLRYLPEVYRSDAGAADFLARFLALFESTFTDVEEEISAATRYLDPDGVPGEALSWLGRWLALSPDGTWSTADERALVRSAPDLFKARGTRRGIRDLLDIYLDEPTFPPRWAWALDQQRAAIDREVAAGERSAEDAARLKELPTRKLYIWEHQDLSCIEDREVRDVYEQVFPCPQCFAVMVWPSIGTDRIREVERLVDETSPAHAIGSVIPLHPSLRLTDAEGDTGYSTFLGVNSVLGERDFELGSSGLGAESELADREAASQLDSTNRLGTDTRMS